MGWQPGMEPGADKEPARGPGQPGARDPRLAGFAQGGEWDTRAPDPELAVLLGAVSGPEWRCPEATDDELIGLLRRWAAIESWVAAAKLGVIRELIRRDDDPILGRPRHGDLPDEWSDSLNHELALALACSVGSAEKTALTAWELGARLPRIAALLADGRLTYGKARLVTETFQWLSDDDAARADELLADRLSGAAVVTFGQLVDLTARIAVQVDPGFAERRRKAAVKERARVRLFREDSGAAGLSGRDLPPDETLAANANVCARAAEYQDSGAFGEARMDSCRATAYLDLLNEITAWERIASGRLVTVDGDEVPGPEDPSDPDDTGPGSSPDDAGPGSGPDDAGPGSSPDDAGPEDSPDDDRPEDRPDAGPGGGGSPPGGDPQGGGDRGGGAGPAPHRPAYLVLPLATLLGLAERPGEGHGFGVLDPALCRSLAALAAASPHTTMCVTVTDSMGIAIGHGCARRGTPAGSPRGIGISPGMPGTPGTPGIPGIPGTSGTADPRGGAPPLVAIPARISLTVTAELLSQMQSGMQGASGPTAASWAFASPGDPGWCGVWTLTLPSGQELAVRLEPVPTYDCDHRVESHGYQPGDKLRHLVQVRDYTCTNPVCSRHARESDFEHALPYLKGGRTCACNAGARSRKCHRIKQSPGWNVTQPRPGWHQWTTPAGRSYTREPWHYPV